MPVFTLRRAGRPVAPLLLMLLVLAQASHAQPVAAGNQGGTPIDVHGMGITETAMLGAVRFDIGRNTEVGTIEYDSSCHKQHHLSLDDYENYSRDHDVHTNVTWGLSAHSINKLLLEKMAQRGYPAYERDLSVFITSQATDADYSIVLTLVSLKFDKCMSGRYGRFSGSSELTAKWEVYSARRQEVVYSRVIQSSFGVPDRGEILDVEFNKRLIGKSIDILQADPAFVAVFKPAKS